jgi:hypothetical protein
LIAKASRASHHEQRGSNYLDVAAADSAESGRRSAPENHINARQHELQLTPSYLADPLDKLALVQGRYQRHVGDRILRQSGGYR